MQRYVSIWFRYLLTDWFTIHNNTLKGTPFVLRTSSHGRMIITAANALAESNGIQKGMVLADAKAIVPDLEVRDDQPHLVKKLLKRLSIWCIQFSPIVSVNLPDGIVLDASGCSHLWGGDLQYVSDIIKKITARGYDVRVTMADTIGTAWGVARFGGGKWVIPSENTADALMNLPPEALRLEPETIELLHKLGLHQVKQFAHMPRHSLRRRFGQSLISRLDMALGMEMETLEPLKPVEPYQLRLPCLEPIVTATGIEIALRHLLEGLCSRLAQDQKGLRTASLKCYRVDGQIEQIDIGTSRPSHSVSHLLKLFETKIQNIEPALGIDLFLLEAPKTENCFPPQERMWNESAPLENIQLAELLDRIANKVGAQTIHRYLPDEHYWPERSFKIANSLEEKPTTHWPTDRPRPLLLLQTPEPIEVSAPIPDYPPMLFRYKGVVHQIAKADGPERIEQEWWLQQGQHRDYYRVEDENGQRYWLFRLGHYNKKNFCWFLHGFFC